MTNEMRDRLIVGLDVPTVKDAEAVVRDLDGTASFYKIGYQLAFAGGLDFARELVSACDSSETSRGSPSRRGSHSSSWNWKTV